MVSPRLLNTEFNLESNSIPRRLLFLLHAVAGSILNKLEAMFSVGGAVEGGSAKLDL